MDRIIGIGEYAVSNDKTDVLKTFALASCVALTAYCPGKNVAGMVHVALPAPDRMNDQSSSRPYYYATTAVPLFINSMCNQYGCNKNDLDVKLFGGAESTLANDVFEIGKKNLQIVKQILADMGVRHDASQTGGKFSRTLEMAVFSGNIKLSLQPLRL